jgi:hypothetical protein
MAISEDAAASVAAQLTVAWATIYAAKLGAGGLLPDQMQGKVWTIYDAFKESVTEVPVTGHSTAKLIE